VQSYVEEGTAMSEKQWALLLLQLGPALVVALDFVLKEVLAKPLLGPFRRVVSNLVERGYRGEDESAAMREAVRAAAQATGLGEWEQRDEYALSAAGDALYEALVVLADKTADSLRRDTMAAMLSMARDAADEVGDELVSALAVSDEHRSLFASFLWHLRGALIKQDEQLARVIQQAGWDEVRVLFRDVAAGKRHLAVRLDGRDPARIEQGYLTGFVVGALGHLPLSGPRSGASGSARVEQVYEALNTAGPAPREGQSIGEGRDMAEREQPRSALRAVLDSRCLVVLGGAGSGKTTFVTHLALCLAGQRLGRSGDWAERLRSHDAEWTGSPLLPVFVSLRRLAWPQEEALPKDPQHVGEAEQLLGYLKRRLTSKWGDEFWSHAVKRFDDADGLLVLDGLDEVAVPLRRRQVAQAIADLAQTRFPKLRFLVTCRSGLYPLDSSGLCTADWALEGFHHVALAGFTPKQIDQFVERWYRALAEDMADGLKLAIRSRRDLQDIASSPVLLTQMALVHGSVLGKLPGTRVQLFEECVRLLLWEWERHRSRLGGREDTAEAFLGQLGVRGLQRDRVESALDQAVYNAHCQSGSGGHADIPRRFLLSELVRLMGDLGLETREAEDKAQRIIDEWLSRRNGLVVPAGEESFRTPHRTFQEFLAARHVWSQREFHRAVYRLEEKNHDLWADAIVLAVGLARARGVPSKAADAIQLLCPRKLSRTERGLTRLVLAGRALAEVGVPTVLQDELSGKDVVKRVETLLRRAMQDVDARGRSQGRIPVTTRYAAGEVLDACGWLPDDLYTWMPVELPSGDRFYIAKYPVANAQYQLFLKAGGYDKPSFWDAREGEGWLWLVEQHPEYRGEGSISEPEYWYDARFGRIRRGYPVVGVSWYEADAYCAWLTALLRQRCVGNQLPDRERRLIAGLPEGEWTLRLPSEGEWLAAAGGVEDGFPWGGEYREGLANTVESGIAGTSPVAMFPAGRSPSGVWDMAGNAWEWLDRPAGSAQAWRPLRGGSWYAPHGYAGLDGRHWRDARYSDRYVGFRVVASPVCSAC
jgi:formylglycine-generating enzyme required for sulfatase activity